MAGFTYPAPFDQPFFLILQLADGAVAPASAATMQIDYAYAWKR